ncbi:hypothetical protein R4315_32435, partial [Rhodococcus oxybenzonivorans]
MRPARRATPALPTEWWKYRLGYDDALDVVGVHLVGGILGTV